MTFDEVRKIALNWPGVTEGTSYGTPALKVGGKMLTRLREDGDTLVVKGVEPEEREVLMAAEPDVFHVTQHYLGWKAVLVRLSKARPEAVEALLMRYYREIAPPKYVTALDDGRRVG